jgi:ABC-type uncharacterized transport system ATPase subunit
MQGVARIPEDRHAVGVVGDLPLWENAVPSAAQPGVLARAVGAAPRRAPMRSAWSQAL